MGKIHTKLIERFDGGITSDLRTDRRDVAGNIKHFEVYRNHLRPHRSTEDDSPPASSDIVKFVYAPNNTSYSLYGFGANANRADFFEKTNPSSELDTWSASLGGVGTGNRNEKVAFYYKNYIYYWEAAGLARFGALSGSRNCAAYQSLSFTNVAEPVHHPADDAAYFFIDNKVYRLDNTTWDGLVLTLPSNLVIKSATAFGNFLAIGCAPVDGISVNSVVFLWDRDSSLATITEKIDWGVGKLAHLGNVSGELIGITDAFTDNAFGLSNSKVVAKKLVGNRAVTTHEIDVTETISSGLGFFQNCNKQETGNELLWGMKVVRGNDTISGIWVYDNKGAMYCKYVEENDDGNAIQGFLKVGNFLWVAHSNNGSVYRTNDQATYSFDSIYDSVILGGDNRGQKKKLIGITVTTEPQPAAGVVTVKYRADAESSYTTVGTNTVDNNISHEFTRTSTGTLPQFYEIQLRIESTGGTVITGISYTYEVIQDGAYEQ